jgi:hypothetical protein
MEQEEERQPTQMQKMLMKLQEHPAIPAGKHCKICPLSLQLNLTKPSQKSSIPHPGMLATCVALGMAFRRMQQRDSAGYQRWLRARVLAQGVTVAAIVVAGMSEFGEVRARKREEKETGAGAAGGVAGAVASASEQRAFEKRMKEAEEAHNTEVLLTTGSSIAGTVSAERALRTSPSYPTGTDERSAGAPGSTPTSAPNSNPNSKSSWLSWLGLSKS